MLYNSFAQRIDTTLNVYADQYQQERAYLHYDKAAYNAGETIWFKAYLMAGIVPSEMNKNFYVDISDAEGNVLAHNVYPIIQASAKGQFEINKNYKGAFVHIKAYTQWMLNFDTAFLYDKDIRVLQKTDPKSTAPKPAIVASLQFFPEGGDAITGIYNRIAFKANDQFGRPVKIKGLLQNSKGATIDSFKSIHDGMGFFNLMPLAGMNYTAKWIDEQGASHVTPLPAAKSTGVNLQVKISGAKRIFIITRTADAPDNLKQLHIAATIHQQLVYMANVKLTEQQSISGAIPGQILPTGVLQITLFDANWIPIAERISFLNNHDVEFNPEVGFSKLGLGKRGRNEIVISLPDSISSNLSVSITDKGIGTDSSNNIISHLLLTGELKGRIYKPAYYFSDDADSIQQHLDLVMLTHGWRRFNWPDVVQGKMPVIKYPKDSSYLFFSGKVFNASPAQLREGGDLLTIIKFRDSSTQTLYLPVKKDGTFTKPGMFVFDSARVYYQFLLNKSLTDLTEIKFFTSTLPSPQHFYVDKSITAYNQWFDTTGNYRNRYLADQQARLEELMKSATLQEVTVKSKTKTPVQILDEKYASGLFRGGDGFQFDIMNDIAAQSSVSVFTYLQGKVAGLQIIPGQDGRVNMQWRGSVPTVFLDEVQQTDVSAIANMNMHDVAYVKVFRPPFFGASGGGAGGAIAVYSRRGGDVKKEFGKGLPTKLVTGYSGIKEFYSPNYGTINEKNEQQDIRSTLYWNPYVLTTYENHKIKISFYNNDITDAFRVIVEGVSKDGKLAHIEKVIE